MEIIDLYDKDRVRTGKTMVRGEPVPRGYFKSVVHLCIFNNKGEMLIQQRQPTKRSMPDLWDFSVAGAVSAGETPCEAIHRETLEELGLDIDFTNERPYFTINFELGFDDYFIINNFNVDINSLKIQAEEVKAVKWARKCEIISMIKQGKFIRYNCLNLVYSMRKARNGYIG